MMFMESFSAHAGVSDRTKGSLIFKLFRYFRDSMMLMGRNLVFFCLTILDQMIDQYRA